MRILVGLVILGLAVAETAPAQPRHNLQFSVGAGQPRGELRSFFNTSVLTGASYGYRFSEFFQLDLGYDVVHRAAGVRDFLPTAFGDVRIRDSQHFLPFGGRAILPFANDRVQIYGGGGGVYMRYTESIRQPFSDSGLRIDCSVCAARHGVGYYGTAGGSVAVDAAQHFRIGGGVRIYRGETDGDAFGTAPPRTTDDRWTNIFGSFTISF